MRLEGRNVFDESLGELRQLRGGIFLKCFQVQRQTNNGPVSIKVRPTVHTSFGQAHTPFSTNVNLMSELGETAAVSTSNAFGIEQAGWLKRCRWNCRDDGLAVVDVEGVPMRQNMEAQVKDRKWCLVWQTMDIVVTCAP